MKGRTQGFVLVNALVLVAALAGVAVFLLMRAEAGRVRLEARQTGAQLALYLDSFESLGVTLLDRDGLTTQNDHLGEAWAREIFEVPLDRGAGTGQLRDLQGLFNVNWLVGSDDPEIISAFEALLAQSGISPQTGAAIRAFLRKGGPQNRNIYARADPPLAPVGGALLFLEQLRDVPQLSAKDLTALARVATALPGDSTLNINTSPGAVMASLLPQINTAALARVLAQRQQRAFTSVTEFLSALETASGAGLGDAVDTGRFSVSSKWFQLEAEATLGTNRARRRAILRRDPFPNGTTVRFRETIRP